MTNLANKQWKHSGCSQPDYKDNEWFVVWRDGYYCCDDWEGCRANAPHGWFCEWCDNLLGDDPDKPPTDCMEVSND